MGVTSVKVQRTAKTKRYDITNTKDFQEALEDVKHGRMYEAESVDGMFQKILGHVPDPE